jgi:cytochrome c2
MRPWCAIAILLSAAPAAADPDARARAIFSERCASCHTVGQGTPLPPMKHKIDLTLVGREANLRHEAARKDPRSGSQASAKAATQHQSDPLRDFIRNPAAQNRDTRCGANNLDEVQLELLVNFLRRRARPPGADKPVAPAAAYLPPAPEPARAPAPPGDHR